MRPSGDEAVGGRGSGGWRGGGGGGAAVGGAAGAGGAAAAGSGSGGRSDHSAGAPPAGPCAGARFAEPGRGGLRQRRGKGGVRGPLIGRRRDGEGGGEGEGDERGGERSRRRRGRRREKEKENGSAPLRIALTAPRRQVDTLRRALQHGQTVYEQAAASQNEAVSRIHAASFPGYRPPPQNLRRLRLRLLLLLGMLPRSSLLWPHSPPATFSDLRPQPHGAMPHPPFGPLLRATRNARVHTHSQPAFAPSAVSGFVRVLPTPQHGLKPDKMALITSDCDAMRSPSIKWA